jgi:hypothetical protein
VWQAIVVATSPLRLLLIPFNFGSVNETVPLSPFGCSGVVLIISYILLSESGLCLKAIQKYNKVPEYRNCGHVL